MAQHFRVVKDCNFPRLLRWDELIISEKSAWWSLEHDWRFFFHMGISSSQLTRIFLRGVGIPPTSTDDLMVSFCGISLDLFISDYPGITENDSPKNWPIWSHELKITMFLGMWGKLNMNAKVTSNLRKRSNVHRINRRDSHETWHWESSFQDLRRSLRRQPCREFFCTAERLKFCRLVMRYVALFEHVHF